MNNVRILGLLLIAAGIILNQLKVENDILDFLMGIFVGAGLVFLIIGRTNLKSEN